MKEKRPKGVPDRARLVRYTSMDWLKSVNPLLKAQGLRVRTRAYARGGGCPSWVWLETLDGKEP